MNLSIDSIVGPILFHPRLPTSAVPVPWAKNVPLLFCSYWDLDGTRIWTKAKPMFLILKQCWLTPYPLVRDALAVVATTSDQERLKKSCPCSSSSEQSELPILLPSHNFSLIAPTEDVVLVRIEAEIANTAPPSLLRIPTQGSTDF